MRFRTKRFFVRSRMMRQSFRIRTDGGVIATGSVTSRLLQTSRCARKMACGDIGTSVALSTANTERSGGILRSVVDFFDKRHSIASEGYNRWLVVPAVCLIQTSIGSVYAWSIFNEPLAKIYGVVAPAAADWSLTSVVPIFSLCAVSLGVTTFTLGSWTERAGPRKVAAVAASCWGSGLMLGAVGAHFHVLPLLYLGYGCLGGIGWGLGYLSPVGALMKWFPDRKGLATGLSLCFFGGGAVVATPVNEFLLDKFSKQPELLGTAEELALTTDAAGRRFAEVAGETYEVVEAVVSSSSELAETAVFAVGTGSTGVAMTFATCSVAHFASMMCGSMLVRLPHTEAIAAQNEDETQQVSDATSSKGLTVQQAMRTPQLYLLWASVFGNAVAGVSVISCAKTMMNECFYSALPAVVTTSFCASYVAMLSGANMTGRLGWAFLSDWTGRKQMYFLFGACGTSATLSIPTLTTMASEGTSGTLPLYMFVGGTVAIVSFYGGLFSVLPAYISDVFGSKHTSGIHGRLLTAWSASALVGPTMMSQLRERSYTHEVEQLAAKTDPATFERTFGASLEHLPTLIEAKTISIERLMQIAPPGTLDPTPNLYDSTLMAMGGIMSAAMIANLAIRKIPFERMPEIGKSEGTRGS